MNDIIKNAIRRDEELRDLRQDFIYQLKVVTERLDDDNKVIPDKTKTVSAKIKPGKDITYSADFNDDSESKSGDASGKSKVAGVGAGRNLRKNPDDDDDDDKDKQVEDAKKVNAMLDMAKMPPGTTTGVKMTKRFGIGDASSSNSLPRRINLSLHGRKKSSTRWVGPSGLIKTTSVLSKPRGS